MMMPTNKQVFTTQSILTKVQKPISLTISVYTNCIFIIINQTGAVGSIIRGQLVSKLKYRQQDSYNDDLYDDQIPEQQPSEHPLPSQQNIYELKVLFGSTEIDFYEVIVRKIMGIIYQSLKFKEIAARNSYKIITNISLKLNSPDFDQSVYYKMICTEIQEKMKEVL